MPKKEALEKATKQLNGKGKSEKCRVTKCRINIRSHQKEQLPTYAELAALDITKTK